MNKLWEKIVKLEHKSSRIVHKFKINISKLSMREFQALQENVMLTSFHLYPRMEEYMSLMDSKNAQLIMELVQNKSFWQKELFKFRNLWQEILKTSTSQ